VLEHEFVFIVFLLLANEAGGAVPCVEASGFGKGEEDFVDGVEQLLSITSWKIGAPCGGVEDDIS